MFLIVIYPHSEWLEVVLMSTTSTHHIIEELRDIFSRFGLPNQLVSDNGPQLIATEFWEFLKSNGVRQAPKHPASNGAAERFVKTFKQAMKAGRWDRSTVRHRLAQFLFEYRSTPSSVTGRAPAELLLKHQMRSKLDLLKPNFIARMESQKVEAAISDTNKVREF